MNEHVNCFYRRGDFWRVSFSGEDEIIRHTSGMPDVCFLLKNPGRRFTTVEFLQARFDRRIRLDAGDAAVDVEAYHNCIAKLAEIDQEIDAAEGFIREDLSREKSKIEKYLQAGLGLSGKRSLKSEVHNQRSAIGNRIDRAVKNINRHTPKLGDHLKDAIKPFSGLELCYWPKIEVEWVFEKIF